MSGHVVVGLGLRLPMTAFGWVPVLCLRKVFDLLVGCALALVLLLRWRSAEPYKGLFGADVQRGP